MKKTAALIAATVTFAAQASDWVPLAEVDTSTWEGRAGTRTEGQTRNGTPVMKAAGRIYNKSTKVYSFVQWYVSIADCKAGYGKLVTLDMSGNVRFDNDFVNKGGSVASSLAEMLCFPVTENEGRGI